jgi:fibro-slime domain-containing protein
LLLWYQYDTNTFGYRIRHDGDQKYISATAMRNEWQHFVITYGSGNMEMFINGDSVAEETGADLQSAVSSYDLLIGCNITTGTSDFYGLLDDVAFFDRVLTDQEIEQLHDSGLDAANDYQLTSGSPCINAGDPDYIAEEDETDLDNEQRIMAARIDMGAYEYGDVIYVDDDASGSGNGQAWSTAYKYLQDALDSAEAGDEIWVADGTYYPDIDESGTRTFGDEREEFQLVNNVAVYGGFALNDSSLSDRDLVTNVTVLSGDIDNEPDYNLEFDGQDDYVSVADDDIFNLNDFAISFWVRPGDAFSDQTFLSNSDGSGESYSFRWAKTTSDATGTLSFEVYDRIAAATAEFSMNIFDGQWHHIVGVRDEGTTLKLYVDGTEKVSVPDETAALIEPSGDLWIGGEYGQTEEKNLEGRIDDVMIFNNVLTSTEISHLKQNKLDGLDPLEGFASGDYPILFWDFDEGSGSSSADSIESMTASLNNGTTWKRCGPGADYKNANHVVTADSTVDFALLDGVKISGGWAKDDTDDDGGGIYCDGSIVEFRNCTITQNIAKDYGGGMYGTNSASSTLTNCLIVGNWAKLEGAGAICQTGGALNLINCTIANNAGDGIRCDSATMTIENCIIWENRRDPSDSEYDKREICLVEDSTANISNSNIEGGQNYIIEEYTTTAPTLNWGSGNISSDPLFVGSGSWEWRLLDGTQLDDGTTPTAIEVDPVEITIYDVLINLPDFGVNYQHDEDTFIGNELVNNIPVYDPPPQSENKSSLSNTDKFALWWTADTINNGPINTNMEVEWKCTDADEGKFKFDSSHFFPIDDQGFGNDSHSACQCISCGEYHNWFFTLQYHTKCRYVPGQTLYFEASDDLFIAINNKIIVDRGGYYVDCPSETEVLFSDGDVTVKVYSVSGCNKTLVATNDITLGLKPDEEYDFELFWAQRSDPYSILIAERTLSASEMEPYFEMGDYHLQSTSDCIDAGDNDAVPVDVVSDLDSEIRFYDDPGTDDSGSGTAPIVDMGAYEYHIEVAPVAIDDDYII